VIDIVVIELKSPFDLNKDLIYPACLPSKGINTESTSCYTSGWGGTKPLDWSEEPKPWDLAFELQAIRVKPLSKNTCLKTYQDFSATNASFNLFSRVYDICIEGGFHVVEPNEPMQVTGTCKGDSGGPLICEGIYHKH
jgi:kallikrein